VTVNPNWIRWIKASTDKHFSSINLPFFIEGQHRDTRTVKDFIEIRVDGPDIIEVNKDYYNFFMEVSILVQSTMDDTNYHRLETSIGLVAAAFTTIKIYKYGTGLDDDGSLLGCFQLQQNRKVREKLQVLRYGQVAPDTKLLHASVEGHYKMAL